MTKALFFIAWLALCACLITGSIKSVAAIAHFADALTAHIREAH